MSEQNETLQNSNKPEELINDAHIKPETTLNEPIITEVKKEENLNEVYKVNAPKAELVQDIPTAPVLSVRQRHQKMVEGKNFELVYQGQKIYDSKSNINFQILENGVTVDRNQYSYAGLTFRIKS